MPACNSGFVIEETKLTQTISIFYTNCNDLRNKMAELMIIPEMYDGRIKILCVTETMFSEDMLTAEIKIPNFTPFRKDRQNNKEGGGSCIYVHESIRAQKLDSFECSDSVAICVESDPYPFILVCVYPSQSLTTLENQDIIDNINKIDLTNDCELVIVGDFNLPDVSWDAGIVVCPVGSTNKSFILQKDFLDMFNYKNLTWLLDDSYITRRRMVNGILQESLLDQILVSNINISRDLRIVSPLGKSDHMGIVFEIKCNNNIDTVTKLKNNWGKFSRPEIENTGNTINWAYSSKDLSANEMCNELDEKLDIITSKAPKIKVKCFSNGSIINKPPWESSALNRKRRDKDKHWALFHENPTKINLNLALAKQGEFDSKLSSILVKYEKQITSKMKQSPKQFFSYLNSKRKIKSGVTELKDENGNLCDDVKKNADILGKFFASTFTKEPDDIQLDFSEQYTDIEISDIEFDNSDVKNLLSELNIFKSEGPDSIHPKILKTLSENEDFVDAVTLLFKKCYDSGKIPEIWKTAKVTALHKKGSKCDAKNYRPISLTCILCKLFEKLIRSHILKHFEPFIDAAQHGFLSGKSCLSNLLNCFEKVDELLANNYEVDIIYLDFQKAFDSVPVWHI